MIEISSVGDVWGFYVQDLGRVPDLDGLLGYLRAIELSASADAIEWSIRLSLERRNIVRKIFVEELGRQPGEAALDNWCRQPMSPHDIRMRIRESPEWKDKHKPPPPPPPPAAPYGLSIARDIVPWPGGWGILDSPAARDEMARTLEKLRVAGSTWQRMLPFGVWYVDRPEDVWSPFPWEKARQRWDLSRLDDRYFAQLREVARLHRAAGLRLLFECNDNCFGDNELPDGSPASPLARNIQDAGWWSDEKARPYMVEYWRRLFVETKGLGIEYGVGNELKDDREAVKALYSTMRAPGVVPASLGPTYRRTEEERLWLWAQFDDAKVTFGAATMRSCAVQIHHARDNDQLGSFLAATSGRHKRIVSDDGGRASREDWQRIAARCKGRSDIRFEVLRKGGESTDSVIERARGIGDGWPY